MSAAAQGLQSYPRATPVSAWPAADRAAWRKALQPRFLEETSRAARWSQRRRCNAALDAGRFLSWLSLEGTASLGCSRIADLATPERLVAFAKAEQARGLKLTSIATALGNVIGVASSIDPERNWRPAWAVLDRLRVHARRLPPAPRHLVHPDDLYGLGLRLMEGSLDPEARVADPDTWQDGLMVALLIAAPMRIANFAALRLGRHVRREGTSWLIVLADDETKTRRADTWPVPQGLVPYLEHHLEAVRPALLRRAARAEDTGALWIGAFGQALGPQGLRKRLTARTRAAFGWPVLPHSFRHSAATSFAVDHPDRPRDAAALLGHTSPRTT